MIRKAGELKVTQNVNMRGGDGTVSLEALLDPSGDEFYGKGRLFSRITLNKGCSIGYHVHEGEMESFFILTGEAVYSDNGTESVLSPGDVTLTQSGQGHGIRNEQDEPLSFVALILYQ